MKKLALAVAAAAAFAGTGADTIFCSLSEKNFGFVMHELLEEAKDELSIEPCCSSIH